MRAMPRRLYLHIGTQKTGTTSLQRYVVDHRDQLRHAGLGVVTETRPSGRTDANCVHLASSVLRPSLLTIARARGDAPPRSGWMAFGSRLRALRTQVRGLGTDRILVSAEALCFARTRSERDRVRAVARACGAQPTIILCIREHGEWRTSWEDQLAKTGYPGPQEPSSSADDVREEWYYDVDAIVAFWSRIGEVRVIRYEDALQRHGSIVPDVVRATSTAYVDTDRPYQFNRRSTADRDRPDGTVRSS